MAKRFYWLKLKENFFQEETIKLLENMENGKDYVIFLLKLKLKTINTNGYLNFKGIMPYNEKMLATITETNIDIVRQALKVFEELALITRLDDGTIYMEQVQNLIGSESESAERVRKHREKLQEMPKEALHGNGAVTKCNTDIDIEKEKEKDRDKIPYNKIISRLNQLSGKKYKDNNKTTREKIRSRWREGYRLEDFETVIKKKCAEWGGDPHMEKYLRPETLFGTKFEGYLNEGVGKKESTGIMEVLR